MDIQGILGLKAIKQRGDTFLSPLYHAEWKPDEVVVAKCYMDNQHSHKAPVDGCTCGIWSSPDPSVVLKFYGSGPDRALMLMEGWGKIILYEDGFRSQNGKLIAVLNVDYHYNPIEPGVYNPQHLTNNLAMEYYSVPMLDLEEASILMAFHWLKDKDNGEPPGYLEKYREVAEELIRGGLDDVSDESIGRSADPIAIDFASMWN